MKNKNDRPKVNPAEKENTAMNTETNITISEDDIRKRAHEIFLERGGLYAPPEADWLQAEKELRSAVYKKKREENL